MAHLMEDYPLALNGLSNNNATGSVVAPPTAPAAPGLAPIKGVLSTPQQALMKRLNIAFGGNTLSEQDYVMIHNAVVENRLQTADVYLKKFERMPRRASRPESGAKYGLQDQLIKGVPNYALYGVAAVAGYFLLKRRK